MEQLVRPVVVVSRCLEFEPVRYNGQVIPYDFVRALEPWVEFVPVCPELEIGLGVPRDPIRIVSIDGEVRLQQPDTGRDLTREMTSFSGTYLGSLAAVDGFILKNRSPSCGIGDVKIFQGTDKSASSTRGSGFFGGRVLELYPGKAIEDEGRLRNFVIREHFLTKLFALARLRKVRESDAMKELVEFQSQNKFLLMAYNQKKMRELGRIVANAEGRRFGDLIADYEVHFSAALARAPRYTSVINVLQHGAGYFKDRLSAGEKAFFAESLARYRARRTPAVAVSAILRTWIARFDQPYLKTQTFFDPYPEELISVSDSGKGRDL